jgi:hypothetical protein
MIRQILTISLAGPCHWTVNTVAALAMAIGYGAIATMASRIEIAATCDTDDNATPEVFNGVHYGVDISGYPLAILGASLLLQSLISVWILLLTWHFHPETIPTWSSDAVVNSIFLIACVKPERVAQVRPCDRSRPRDCARSQVPRTRVLARLIWTSFGILAICLAVNAYFAGRADTFVAKDGDIWQGFGFVYTSLLDSGVTDWAGMTPL